MQTYFLVLFLAIYAVYGIEIPSENVEDICGTSLSDRIIGGYNAEPGQYPWIARLGLSSLLIPDKIFFICGASLISRRYVITAAHCVAHPLPLFSVTTIRLGEYDTRTNPDCINGICVPPVQDIRIKNIIIHEGFSKTTGMHDIALIRLARPAEINGYVIPICLPYGLPPTRNFTDTKMEVAGWGVDNIHSENPSDILQRLTIPIRSLTYCKGIFRGLRPIRDGQICAGGVVGEDSCTGDSGGPLMKVEVIGNNTPRYYLFGAVSFGSNDCGDGLPAIYTNIRTYLDWIKENMF